MEAFRMIPLPREGKPDGGKTIIAAKVKCENGHFETAAEVLSDALDRLHGQRLMPGEGGIRFEKKEALAEDEYELQIIPNGCTALCGSEESASYAAATLTQLMRFEDGHYMLPCGSLRDKPQSPWRGLMVDLARAWHPLPLLFRYVDLCWLYKINRLQLHFIDDQSYTLPSRAFPDLPGRGRHYTEAELAHLEEYAKARGVTLVPEIEAPGHSGEFNRKYPEIFGDNGILCCEEKTFDAIEQLLEEICRLFPDSPYIHIGGDEAAIAKWNDCPGCVAYREAHGLANEHAQYAHYVDRVAKMVLALGRKPVAWEGFGKEYNSMVTKDLILFSWENYYQPAYDLAAGGFTIINASWKPTYVCTSGLMWDRSEILNWNPRIWTHWWEKSVAYQTTVTVPDSAVVLGGQMNAWGDRLSDAPGWHKVSNEEFDRVSERLPALAQRTWQHKGDVAEDAVWDEIENLAKKLIL